MITLTLLRSGQVKAYGDSVTAYRVDAENEPEEEVKAFCLKDRPSLKNETTDDRQCDGFSGFPFGLESFFRFRMLSKNTYTFTIVHPYCD